MAIIGTVAVAEGFGGTVVTTDKTSTAGSVVVGGGAAWHASVALAPNITSSLAGTYTKASDKVVNDGAARVGYGLTYNLAGTRAASHNLTIQTSPSGNQARSLSWQEFDSIDTAGVPIVGTESSSALSNDPTCSVTIPSGTATVIAIMTYVGSSTTATVDDGTQISEADENSDSQAHFIAAKFGVSGTVQISWQLAAARGWACYAVAFPETGGGGGGRVTKNRRNSRGTLGVRLGVWR